MHEYVYGIVETSATAPAGTGIGGARVRLITGDHAAALVSELPGREVELGREALMTHARVVEEAAERGTALPMRLGVVMDGADDVSVRLLAGHGEELGRQLRRFAGKAEMRIRATYDEALLLTEVVREEPAIAGMRLALAGRSDDATYFDRMQLGELVATATERKRERDGRELVELLSQLADDVAVTPTAHERVALNASFLVDRKRLAEFDSVLDAYAEGQGGRLRFRCTGPLPPHSFVELGTGS